MQRLPALLCVLFLLALPSAGSDLRVLVEGPAVGGVVELGLHDDYLGLENCGGTCFAPTVCAVFVPVQAGDTPLEVARAIASAVESEASCNSSGFRARALPHPAGAVLEISDGSAEQFNACVNFQTLSDRLGLCEYSTGQTPGGVFTTLAATFCQAKGDGNGCAASIGTVGNPSSASGESFEIVATRVAPGSVGLMLYGFQGGLSLDLGNGVLCLDGSLRRAPAMATLASMPPLAACAGGLSFDFRSWFEGGQDPALGIGSLVAAQYWIRAPEHWDGSGFAASNAVEFVVEP